MGNRAESQDLIDLGNRIRKKAAGNSLITGSISRKNRYQPQHDQQGLREDRQQCLLRYSGKLAVILKTDAGTLLGECKGRRKPSSV